MWTLLQHCFSCSFVHNGEPDAAAVGKAAHIQAAIVHTSVPPAPATVRVADGIFLAATADAVKSASARHEEPTLARSSSPSTAHGPSRAPSVGSKPVTGPEVWEATEEGPSAFPQSNASHAVSSSSVPVIVSASTVGCSVQPSPVTASSTDFGDSDLARCLPPGTIHLYDTDFLALLEHSRGSQRSNPPSSALLGLCNSRRDLSRFAAMISSFEALSSTCSADLGSPDCGTNSTCMWSSQQPNELCRSTQHRSTGAGGWSGSGSYKELRKAGGDSTLQVQDGLLAQPLNIVAGLSRLKYVNKGAFGVVYQGLWQGQLVAVKLITCRSFDVRSASLREVLLSRDLLHPNVVKTLQSRVAYFDHAALDSMYQLVREADLAALSTNDSTSHTGGDFTSEKTTQLTQSHASLDCGYMQLSTEDFQACAHAQAAHMLALSPGSVHQTLCQLSGSIDMPTEPTVIRPEASKLSWVQDTATTAGGSSTCRSSSDTSQLAAAWRDLRALNLAPGDYVSFVIMEYCDMGTLESMTCKDCFDPARGKANAQFSLVNVAMQVAEGMAYLHAQQLMHGDLKPANVLLHRGAKRNSVCAKIADLGMVKLVATSAGLGGSPTDVGTVAYSAPENLEAESVLASDVYSFGIVMWQMAAGKRPYVDLNMAQVMFGILYQDLKLEWPAGRHEHLKDLYKRCVAFKPAERPTFAQVVEDLRNIDMTLRRLKAQA